MFSLAFFCGWLFRNALRRSEPVATHPDITAEAHETSQISTKDDELEHEYAFVPNSSTATNPKPVPDLAVDFPWDEAALDDTANLSSEERIARLEKQNASKAEIIKALEILVAENREKWLHRDETEARLDKHIHDLSADLRVAVRQLQQLQAETSEATQPRKTLKSGA